MARVRISTTVDADLMATARDLLPEAKDAKVIDEALKALHAGHRSAEIDKAYVAAYEKYPLDTPDEWGDLESFAKAAKRS